MLFCSKCLKNLKLTLVAIDNFMHILCKNDPSVRAKSREKKLQCFEKKAVHSFFHKIHALYHLVESEFHIFYLIVAV